MTLHPILELLFNPFAGPAGLNLISVMTYITIALLVLMAVIERNFHKHN